MMKKMKFQRQNDEIKFGTLGKWMRFAHPPNFIIWFYNSVSLYLSTTQYSKTRHYYFRLVE